MHRAGAAEGEQREVPRIVAALDCDHANRALHVGVDDANYAARRRGRICFHLAREPRHCVDGAIRVELHLAAEEVCRDQSARDQIGVGHGTQIAAAVTCGTGIGACAIRPDLERAAGVDTRDRTAAGTDGVNVDHGGAHRVSIGMTKRADSSAPIEHRHVSRGPAHVKRDEAVGAECARETRSANHTSGGTRQNRAHRLRAG